MAWFLGSVLLLLLLQQRAANKQASWKKEGHPPLQDTKSCFQSNTCKSRKKTLWLLLWRQPIQAIFFYRLATANCDSSFRPIVFWRRISAWRSSSKLSAYVSLKQLEINKKWAKKTTFSDDENFGTVRRVPRQRPAPRRRLLHNVLR